MEDNISTILYIVIGVIYFVYSIIKKNKGAKPPSGGSNPIPGNFDDLDSEGNSGAPTSQRPSFDDLLREFTQESRQEPEVQEAQEIEGPVFQEAPQTQYVEPTRKPTAFESYHNNEVDLDDNKFNQSLFDAYDQDESDESSNKVAMDIKAMLKDPDGIKKAIIINEILRPKYF